MTARRVYLVPLAARGFVPVDPERNPVRWHLEDAATGRPIEANAETADEARAYATRHGWTVDQ